MKEFAERLERSEAELYRKAEVKIRVYCRGNYHLSRCSNHRVLHKFYFVKCINILVSRYVGKMVNKYVFMSDVLMYE